MKRSCYNITLDIREGQSACLPEMKQTDTHRRLCIRLTDGGDPYPVTPDCYPVFTAKKPDGTVIYNRCTLEDGAVIYDVTPQTTSAPGLLACELRLLAYDTPPTPEEDGTLPEEGAQVLTSAAFGIRIHPAVYNENEALSSEGEVSALSALVVEARQTVDALKDARDAGEFDGQSATHHWDGTVLTVTSAAGTSAADLKGPQGEKGEKGEKGDPATLVVADNQVGGTPWSSQNIADRFCPAFLESGILVRCSPLADYPLAIFLKSNGESTDLTLHILGKNLYNREKYPLDMEGYVYRGSGKFSTTSSSSYRHTNYIPAAHLAGQTITLNYAPTDSNHPGMAFYDKNKTYLAGGVGNNIPVPEGTAYLAFSVAAANCEKDVQLELGSYSTAYEPYREDVHFYSDEHTDDYLAVTDLLGRTGDMIFYAENELGLTPVQVGGRWDPKVLLSALMEAVYRLQQASAAVNAS